MARNDCDSAYLHMNGVQPKVELQIETSKVVGTSVVINTYGACSNVKPIELMVVVADEFDNVGV